MKTRLTHMAVLALASLLTACSTPGGGSGRNTPTDAEILQMNQEDKLETFVTEVETEQEVLVNTKTRLYKSELPVTFGNEKTGYTMQWDKFNRVVHYYPGHQTSHFGIDQENTLSLMTDEEGRILFQNTRGGIEPVRLLANVATQEGMGRVWSKLGVQFGSSVGANLGVGLINAATRCEGDECGGPTVINQVGASAGARSESISQQQSGVSVTTGGCASGTCAGWRTQ